LGKNGCDATEENLTDVRQVCQISLGEREGEKERERKKARERDRCGETQIHLKERTQTKQLT
jgi:hypothetical protein